MLLFYFFSFSLFFSSAEHTCLALSGSGAHSSPAQPPHAGHYTEPSPCRARLPAAGSPARGFGPEGRRLRPKQPQGPAPGSRKGKEEAEPTGSRAATDGHPGTARPGRPSRAIAAGLPRLRPSAAREPPPAAAARPAPGPPSLPVAVPSQEGAGVGGAAGPAWSRAARGRAAPRGMELGPGPCALPAGAGAGSGSGGPCAEMLQVAEEAFRGGNFELAAEIYGSELAELPQPERGLCLRRADALARAGRMAEALDAYGAAARLARLRPEELRELAESLALSIRDKELRLPPPPLGSSGGGAEGEALGDPACCRPPELFACPLCRRLLCEPVTLHCGHTHCRRCAEPGDCGRCHRARRPAEPSAAQPQPPAARPRVNVVLGNLLQKWFGAESRARRLRAEGDELRERQELPAALEKYDQALEMGERRLGGARPGTGEPGGIGVPGGAARGAGSGKEFRPQVWRTSPPRCRPAGSCYFCPAVIFVPARKVSRVEPPAVDDSLCTISRKSPLVFVGEPSSTAACVAASPSGCGVAPWLVAAIRGRSVRAAALPARRGHRKRSATYK